MKEMKVIESEKGALEFIEELQVNEPEKYKNLLRSYAKQRTIGVSWAQSLRYALGESGDKVEAPFYIHYGEFPRGMNSQ